MTSHYHFFATAPKFTESLLLQELHHLGATDATETLGGVSFSGNLALAYRACLWSRIANRILLTLKKATIASADDLYDVFHGIQWAEHFSLNDTFAIDLLTSQSVITHTQYGAQKCKDAIVDQFRQASGQRPSVDKASPDIRINVHVKRNTATISLDLSGHSLHQRGYRQHNVSAPLKENLAAALLMRARWPEELQDKSTFIDPMCGSGTLLIEAACIAANIAPGLFRDDFGFNAWRHHEQPLWNELRHTAQQQRHTNTNELPRIIGFDEDSIAIDATTQNIACAGLGQYIEISRRSIADLANNKYGKHGLIVSNPPYGERLQDNESLIPLYQSLGEKLQQHFRGWNASIITSDPSLAKAMGLHYKRRNKFYNGKLLCQLYHFHIGEEAKTKTAAGKSESTREPAIDNALQNRLVKNHRQLRKWADKQGIHCYRLYDADLPEYNFAVDLYLSDKAYVVVQEYAAPANIDRNKVARRRNVAMDTVMQVLDIPSSQLFYKQRSKQAGKQQYEKLGESKQFHEIHEHNAKFYVNFTDYLDTGLFLDHRDTREIIGQKAKDKTFLNLFCYTGAASVYAALAGAQATTSVDLSTTYIDWCKNNFALNDIPLEKHQFIKADCIQWLETEKNRYQLIFVDPPTFSNSKMMDGHWDVQHHHVWLLRQCLRILDNNGEMVFSTNFRQFQFDEQAFSDCHIENITGKTIPRDFARNPKIHQCWIIKRGS
ncbi:MAG: bifunctional 23S rRNA (guanine(2069)-N(7))-methyltransferase RlmK/23S rRNA (guanine(2445)-N(2))-methyltransferase RlmL [Gammaproteobacteria bacterium]|jgi:23S rRNA (guanine2445-N2)-methyltransferase / 23S rRNA (guanine2069-N7)-methyltransferase